MGSRPKKQHISKRNQQFKEYYRSLNIFQRIALKHWLYIDVNYRDPVHLFQLWDGHYCSRLSLRSYEIAVELGIDAYHWRKKKRKTKEPSVQCSLNIYRQDAGAGAIQFHSF